MHKGLSEIDANKTIFDSFFKNDKKEFYPFHNAVICFGKASFEDFIKYLIFDLDLNSYFRLYLGPKSGFNKFDVIKFRIVDLKQASQKKLIKIVEKIENEFAFSEVSEI